MTYTVPDTASAFGIQHRSARCENRTKQLCSSTCQERDAVAFSEDASDDAALVALHNWGCSWGLNPPVSRSARVMSLVRFRKSECGAA